jgi:hypothetical protein
MGFEPTTPTLARLCSTTELHPHSTKDSTKYLIFVKTLFLRSHQLSFRMNPCKYSNPDHKVMMRATQRSAAPTECQLIPRNV